MRIPSQVTKIRKTENFPKWSLDNFWIEQLDNFKRNDRHWFYVCFVARGICLRLRFVWVPSILQFKTTIFTPLHQPRQYWFAFCSDCLIVNRLWCIFDAVCLIVKSFWNLSSPIVAQLSRNPKVFNWLLIANSWL